MTHSTESSRCTYRDPAGRRCRLPRKPRHPAYCVHHARFSSEGVLEDPEQLAADVLGTEIDFSDARSLNRVAGKLLLCFLSGRIPARHAAVAGYLCQLVIQTLPHIERQERPPAPEPIEYQFVSDIPQPDYSEVIARYQAERELRKQKSSTEALTK
jgi:hypothetical protein